MNIGKSNKGVAARLSNFTARSFIFDGVECASMEGLLQAFKYHDTNAQKYTCTLVGIAAKRKGKGRNKRWQSLQMLWWNDITYKRKSDNYQDLLTRAYDALNTNEQFRKDLEASGDAVFTHNIGHNDESKTVLTEREFCRQLHRLRKLNRI
jgi:hypothetical protein